MDDLIQHYNTLATYPEVNNTLTELSENHSLSVLSNANPEMLIKALEFNKIHNLMDEVISTDRLQMFKPRPEVYQLTEKILNIEKAKITFISSNTWDISGAKSFGLKTIWLNRNKGTDEKLGFAPDLVIHGLEELLQ